MSTMLTLIIVICLPKCLPKTKKQLEKFETGMPSTKCKNGRVQQCWEHLAVFYLSTVALS